MHIIQPYGTVLPRPCWPPNEKDWSDYRHLITQLYIDKDITLENIISILETNYGFKASEKMYKTRFKRWRLKKYVSACDKEAVAQMLKVYRKKGVKAPCITLDNRPVPLHVIRRHCRRKRIFDKTCDSLPYAPQLDVARIQINRLMTQNTRLDSVEAILLATSPYFNWHFESDFNPDHFDVSARPWLVSWGRFYRAATHANTFWESIGRGLDLLAENEFQHGWLAIDEGCELTPIVIQEQHRGLLKLIYLLFSDERWQSFTDLRNSMFQYLISMTTKLLGRVHPLSTIIRLCDDPETFHGSSHVILKVVLDISRRYLCEDTAEMGQPRRAQCDILRMNRAYDSAEVEAEILVRENEIMRGPNNEETIRALRRLAHVYIDQQRYSLAEPIYQDVLCRSRIELGDDFPDESSIYAYQNLAGIYSKRGDLIRAVEYWRLAYDGAVYQFGAEHHESCYCRKNLDQNMLKQAALGEEVTSQTGHSSVASRRSDLNFQTTGEFACLGPC